MTLTLHHSPVFEVKYQLLSQCTSQTFPMATSMTFICFLLFLAVTQGVQMDEISMEKGDNFQLSLSSANKCLSQFQSDRAHFEPCVKTVCFLFLFQPPFVVLDPVMTKVEHQSLFPCKNRRKLFPHLRGSSFEIHQVRMHCNEMLLHFSDFRDFRTLGD